MKLAKGLEWVQKDYPLVIMLSPFANLRNLPSLAELPFRSLFHPPTVTFNPL
jgi:hypothetical protein